jgi:hypothetical protein
VKKFGAQRSVNLGAFALGRHGQLGGAFNVLYKSLRVLRSGSKGTINTPWGSDSRVVPRDTLARPNRTGVG